MSQRRLFCAALLPPKLQDVFQETSLQWRESTIRWTLPSQLHLTLQFLGNQNEQLIPTWIQILQNVAQQVTPIPIEWGEVAYWNSFSTQIVVLKLSQGQNELIRMIEVLNGFKSQAGIEPGRREKYQPHVTLAKCKSIPPNFKSSCEFLSHWPRWIMNRFQLFESHLSSTGATYQKLYEFELKV
jgi:2'-5' RNA ligase